MSSPLDMRWSRKVKGEVSSVTVTKDAAGRYFASLLVTEEVEALPVVSKESGIDLGLKDALITSDGLVFPNPKFYVKSQKRLARAQRSLSRKKKGSKNRAKARVKVARIHAKVADSRRDWSHKLTTQLIRENQVISAESLSVKNMVKNRSLAKAIHDVGWSEIVRQLDYKAKWYGRTFVQIDRFYPSSKRCSCCGHTLAALPLATRVWVCPECDTQHDRDINAAINIREAGMAILAGADMLRMHEKSTAGLAET
jgi:putative transposase